MSLRPLIACDVHHCSAGYQGPRHNGLEKRCPQERHQQFHPSFSRSSLRQDDYDVETLLSLVKRKKFLLLFLHEHVWRSRWMRGLCCVAASLIPTMLSCGPSVQHSLRVDKEPACLFFLKTSSHFREFHGSIYVNEVLPSRPLS